MWEVRFSTESNTIKVQPLSVKIDDPLNALLYPSKGHIEIVFANVEDYLTFK